MRTFKLNGMTFVSTTSSPEQEIGLLRRRKHFVMRELTKRGYSQPSHAPLSTILEIQDMPEWEDPPPLPE